MGRNRLLPSVPDALTRSGTPVPGVPLVEVCSNRRVLIENHQGVVAYQVNEIVVKVRTGRICVCGEHLQLIRMNRSQLVITGRVSAVHFREMC